jgi:hypothetical protein
VLCGFAVVAFSLAGALESSRPLLFPTGQTWMNPKHFHTPVSTRLRCPVCHQPVYSRGGIHPQCAMRQSEPVIPKLEPAEIAISSEEAVVAAALPRVHPLRRRPAGEPKPVG